MAVRSSDCTSSVSVAVFACLWAHLRVVGDGAASETAGLDTRARSTRSRRPRRIRRGGWRAGPVAQAGDFDVDVQAVEDRSAQARLVFLPPLFCEQVQGRAISPRKPHGQGFIDAMSCRLAG